MEREDDGQVGHREERGLLRRDEEPGALENLQKGVGAGSIRVAVRIKVY